MGLMLTLVLPSTNPDASLLFPECCGFLCASAISFWFGFTEERSGV